MNYAQDSDVQEQDYIVDFIYGKRKLKDDEDIHYAVKWQGFSMDQMTWEQVSSFNEDVLKFALRFERCFSYQLYHSKQQKRPKTVRIHILGNMSEVHRKINFKTLPSILDDQVDKPPKREFYEEDNNDDIQFIRRGRGRPRKIDQEREWQRPINFQDKPYIHNRTQSQAIGQMTHQGINLQAKYNIKQERDYINEIINNAKLKQPNNFNNKKAEYEEDPIRKLHDNRKLIQTENDIEYQTPIFYSLQLEVKQYNEKIIFELIHSHHLIKELSNKLVFKCSTEEDQILYVEYDTLKSYCPTLLLDYMMSTAVLL